MRVLDAVTFDPVFLRDKARLEHAPRMSAMKSQQPPIPSSKCIDAHEALGPLLPILDAFNHRHKNQHRASHWWAELQILRRSVRALATAARQANGSSVRSRADWMKKRIVSRSYR
jgi:hypothetical protein